MKNPVVSNTVTSLENLHKGGYNYPFKRLCKNKITEGEKSYDHVYTFSSKHQIKYQANLIEYNIGVFAVKFHQKLYQKHPDRYKILTNKGDAIIVLKTIVAIMHDLLSQKDDASFAFMGMPLINEGIEKTKRYGVYKKFCQRYFSYDNFEHVYDHNKSFYMLINRKKNLNDIVNKIKKLAETELVDDIEIPKVNFSRSTK
ncbi:MAG: hypothetical protein JST26_06700 [Bacteroidetes bacterium]|nr:hypothetical protein [Bacteroidota bacterium]